MTAGASAPEILVDEVIESARGFFDVTVKEIPVTQEDVVFKVPSILNSAA